MFKIKIITVGELNEKFYKDAEAMFVKRISKFAKLEFACIKESTSRDIKTKIEKESLELEKYFNLNNSVLLSIEANCVSSLDIASMLETHKNQTGEIRFFIGGSNGVSKNFNDKFKHKISLGKITLPHCLAKIVLLEQVYRGLAILNNLPYHK